MCQRCNGNCTSCKCTCKKRCVNQNCTCPVIITTDCINSFTEELPCSGIPAGQTLNETIVALDAFICGKFGSVSAFFDLISVGTGAEIYKGTNNLGQKEIKSLLATGLITITEQADTVTITVNETLLETFIQDNQLTYSASNIGEEGASIYAGDTEVGDNTDFNFRTIKSDTLIITQNENDISIEQPMTASIPALYVNSAYIPTYDEFVAGNTKGQGTLAKPYTNTVSYASPVSSPVIAANTAIQNALDAYVGDGTRLNPDLEGQQIIIQNNNSSYTFPGDFNYTGLGLKIEGNVLSTTTGYLLDMDDSANFNALLSNVVIEISEGVFLEIQGLGFRNSGSNVATNNFTNGRQIDLLGSGTIYSEVNEPDNYIFNLDPIGTENGTTGFNNDGGSCIVVRCNILATKQGIVKVGGKSKIDFYGELSSGAINGTVDTDLKAFYQTGGLMRFFGAKINFQDTSNRVDGFYIEPLNTHTPNFQGRDVQLGGAVQNIFTKANSSLASFDWQNGTSLYLTASALFDSPNLWVITFNNNNILASVDFSIVDFSQSFGVSTLNLLGNYVTASLIIQGSKKDAVDAGLDKYSLFINRKTVASVDLVEGVEYKIASVGTTDFTLLGATANTVGLFFTKNATSGSGTGNAYLDVLDIVT